MSKCSNFLSKDAQRMCIWPTGWSSGKWQSSFLVDQYYLVVSSQLEQLERLRSENAPSASWLPILLVHIGSQVKTRQSQSYKCKKMPKFIFFKFWRKKALHATHRLKLLDKMCKYEMDPASIVEYTERTRFCPQTDRRTDGRTDRRTDKVKPVYPGPLSTSLKRGYNSK